jgi:uncharacterized protein YuzB (UPF0349 family)
MFALFLALGGLMSSTAADIIAAPQSGNTDLANQFQVLGTSSLEVNVVRCDDDFDPNDLFGTCHDNGEGDVTVRIVSADSELGIDQTQATVTSDGGGPGRTSFTELPAGDYNLNVDLTAESGVRYFVYCGIAGGGQELPANPDDALNTVVTVPDASDVACDIYIIPTEPALVEESSIELFAFTCEADVLPDSGGREFDDFQPVCTEVAENVDFTLVASDDTEILVTTDEDGKAEFTYPAGSPITFYSGVPLGSMEWLFCSVDDGEAEDIEIDSQGVSTFENAVAEDRICVWFLVEDEDDAATETATEQATEVTVEQLDQDSSLDLVAYLCANDAVSDTESAGFSEFQQACGDVAPDVDFQLNTGEYQSVETTDDNGQISFNFPVGEEVDFFAVVPLGSDEHLFCGVDGGDAAAVALDDQGVAHFSNTEASAQACSWYLIEEAPDTEAVVEQSTEESTAEATEDISGMAASLGGITFFPSVCPLEYDPEVQGVEYEALSANCAQGVEDVSFTFGLPNGDTNIRISDGVNPIAFADLEPGTYTLFSDVPLEAAQEFVFCTADGGNRYQKELDDHGVTTFGELQAEQIACEWFIVPTDLRGEETGGSLEIHLAVCPANYTGDAIFDDCHGNGLEDFEFTLTGPDGVQTGTTEIQQDPGPGVVNFTSLASGEYTFNGGPPGDFGEIRLFCSTQPGNETPDFSIEGGTGSLTLGENEHVLCDWYFVPEDASGPGPTETTTPEPARAEILVTLYACPPASSGTYGGSSLATYQEACTETVNDVSFRVGNATSAPLSAESGASGEGAVRFFELLPGDLTMNPSLPPNLTSAAVFCTIDGGSPYQKALSNGGTTFVNVAGGSIACSWFAVEDRVEQAAAPSGSITIREYLCEDDASEIVDWDAECAPGSTGTSYTIGSTSSGATADGTPDDNGVFVFGGLSNGFYTLEQNTGNWCRAVADRVDSQSRVIVEGGGNTDVVLYQCNAVEGLPDTGSGPGGSIPGDGRGLTGASMYSIALGLLIGPLAWVEWVKSRIRRVEHIIR